jgi:hypothetical protein
MNERIKELAEQVGAVQNVLAMGRHDGVLFTETELEKFAELIVAECVAICKDVDGEDNIDARSGRQDCAVEIKEHFGVEE